MINNTRLVEEFMEYVTIDSESFNEKNFHDHILKQLLDLGFEIQVDNTGDLVGSNANNIIARRPGTLTGKTLGLCAHLDTVTPGNGIKPIIKDNVIYSEGDTILGADDKAGVAIIIEIVRSAIENELPLGPIEIFFSIVEESGIQGTKHMKEDALEAKEYYVLDGIGYPGEIVIGGPANNTIDVTIHGKPAHAGLAPETGISAIEVISDAISQMTLGRISPITTANIGIIQGGMANNIVCPELTLSAEVRSHSEEELNNQTDHMHEMIALACGKYNADFEYSVDKVYPSFKIDNDNSFLNFTKTIIEQLDLKYEATIGGGGSDANNLSHLGITPIILGIGIKNCHTTDESIAIPTLELSAKMCYEFMKEYWT